MPSKKPRIQLYADECIPIPSITYLKQHGISIIHAYDIDFIGVSDSKHLKKSRQIKRVLLSLDKDFKKFEEASLVNHPGVILLATTDITANHINKILIKALPHITQTYAKESLMRVSVNKIIREKDGVIFEKLI